MEGYHYCNVVHDFHVPILSDVTYSRLMTTYAVKFDIAFVR